MTRGDTNKPETLEAVKQGCEAMMALFKAVRPGFCGFGIVAVLSPQKFQNAHVSECGMHRWSP